MLIKDEQKQAEHAIKTAIESNQSRLAAWEDDSVRNAVYVTDEEFNPGNPQLQMGRAMMPGELERKLTSINPNFIYEVHARNKTKKSIYLPVAGEKKHLVIYENSYMPEHSIMRLVKKDIRDMSVNSLDRKDLPKHEWSPERNEWVFDDSAPMPGMKRVLICDRELVRGWRTVLLRLIQNKYITISDAERVFGTCNDSRWAYHTKGNLKSPW